MEEIKICRKCNFLKPLEEFHFRTDSKSYRNVCKVCRRLHHYSYNLERRYGIDLDTKIQMFEDQNKSCKICDLEGDSHNDFHVDHCHSTGRVRGLLCNNCNAGLGMFQDNLDLLFMAIDYLTDEE